MKLAILVIVVGYFCFRIHRFQKRESKKNELLRLHNDLSVKFRELTEDPTMTEQKWLEWAKVFSEADAMINQAWGDGFSQIGRLARQWAHGTEK